MVDRARALSLIDTCERHVALLEEMTPRALAAYAGDARTRLAVERALQVSIEAVLDASAVVAAGKRLGVPADEADVAARLQEAGCLTEQEAVALRELRRFRTVLVHQYGKLDDARVHRHAQGAPAALRGIVGALRRCM